MQKPRLHWKVIVPSIVVPAFAAAMIFPGVASAGGPKPPKPQKVVCTSVSGQATGTVTLSSCLPTLQTGGSGTIPGSSLGATGNLTVTWANGATTTVAYHTAIPSGKGNKCPAGSTEAILAGSVTGNANLPTGDGGVKAAVKSKICFDSNFNITLLAGQTFKL